jgi:hypothetical protein
MSRSTSSARLFLSCLALLVAIGCSNEGELDEGQPIATYEADPAGEGSSAQLIGTIDLSKDCLTVEDELDGPFVPVFPDSEVEWDGSALTYLGKTYQPGDEITLGGGPGGDEVGTIPDGCGRTRPWLVAPSPKSS